MVRKTLYAGGNIEIFLTWGDSDIIRSEIVDLPGLKLNVRSSEGSVDE